MKHRRVTYVGRIVKAGCDECDGNDALWHGKNAQGVAARHHDATGHRTWVEVYMNIAYESVERDEESRWGMDTKEAVQP